MMRTHKAVLAAGSVLCAVAIAGPSVAAGWVASRPAPVIETDNALDAFGPQWWAEGSDHTSLWIADPSASAPVIVMVHGYRQPRSDLRRLANNLHDRGYGIVLPELPYLDGSEPYSGGTREAAAIRNAVEMTRHKFGRQIVLMGFSDGGFASGLAVRDGLQVGALITDSAYVSAPTTFREAAHSRTQLPTFMFAGLKPAFYLFSKGGALDDIRSGTVAAAPPTFVIHCQTDTFVTPDNAIELQEVMGGEVWLAPGQGHGGAWYADPTGYESRVDMFVKSAALAS